MVVVVVVVPRPVHRRCRCCRTENGYVVLRFEMVSAAGCGCEAQRDNHPAHRSWRCVVYKGYVDDMCADKRPNNVVDVVEW